MNTSNDNQRKRNLYTPQHNASMTRTVQRHVDEKGWIVIESDGPGGRTVLRYNLSLGKLVAEIDDIPVYIGKFSTKLMLLLKECLEQYEKIMDTMYMKFDHHLGFPDYSSVYLEEQFSDDTSQGDMEGTVSTNNSWPEEDLEDFSFFYSNFGCLLLGIVALLGVCSFFFGIFLIAKVISDVLMSLF